jgi:transcriptional regulator with XRE-family HTH domain
VIALRKKLKMSQSVFAAALNVSTKLVQSWEQGVRMPDRGELRLIEILTKQPELVSSLILSGAPRRSPPKVRKTRKRTPETAVAS